MKLVQKSEKEISIAELKEAINAGRGPEVIKPGDELEITLKNGERAIAVCGGYVSPITARFIFRNCVGERHVMNKTATNKGGYLKSEGRRHVIEDILPLLPDELSEALSPRNMQEVINGETHEYADTLWLPSATDVFGPGNWWDEEQDSVQLDIFKTERDRVKMSNGETWFWWLRSPRASGNYASSGFVCVYPDGTVYSSYASNSDGFAPGFDL